MDLIQKRGSWFAYNGTQLAQGRDAAKDALKADEALYNEISDKVREKLDAAKKK